MKLLAKLGAAAIVPAIVLLAVAASAPASAHGFGGGPRFGIGVVVPFPGYYPGYYSPWYDYPPGYAYEPPVVYVQPTPAAAPAAAPAAQSFWYYCADSKMYYPYAKDCPSPWQQVSPQPQAPRPQ
jgi:hypothetical protein